MALYNINNILVPKTLKMLIDHQKPPMHHVMTFVKLQKLDQRQKYPTSIMVLTHTLLLLRMYYKLLNNESRPQPYYIIEIYQFIQIGQYVLKHLYVPLIEHNIFKIIHLELLNPHKFHSHKMHFE